MATPLEVELLIAAWDNAKKNLFDGDDMRIDPETGEIIDAVDMPDRLGDLVMEINDRMMDLVAHYREEMPDNVFYGQDEESRFVGIRYDESDEDDIPDIVRNAM